LLLTRFLRHTRQAKTGPNDGNCPGKYQRKKPLKSLDDLPKDYVGPDPYLDEADKIAVDLLNLEKAQGTTAASPAK